MEIQETALPGDGLRHEFTTSGGRQLGVVSYRTGRRHPRPTLASSPATPRWSSAPPAGSRRWPDYSADCHAWKPSWEWGPVRPVGQHLRGQPAAAGAVCSCSPDHPPARPAAPSRCAQDPGCRLWGRVGCSGSHDSGIGGPSWSVSTWPGNGGRGHRSDPHRARSPLHPRRCRTLALHRGGLRPGGRHHVDAPLDRSGGRDRRDRPGPHPRWRVRPCRRLPQQPTPNPHGVHALTPPSTQSPYSFERRWTVVMLADLLLGHSQSLRIEVPGKQGEGAEFRLLAHGVPEWHQAKRQRGGGPWTIANMATEGILGPWWPKIQAGGRCVFVSGRRKAKTRGSIRLGGPPSQRGPRRRPRRSLGPRPARPG